METLQSIIDELSDLRWRLEGVYADIEDISDSLESIELRLQNISTELQED